MALKYFLLLLFTFNVLINRASAAVAAHSHNVDNNLERESDGSYRPRDFQHYNQAGHNSEFDHEAILGSVKEAEEYDKLSPEEAKQRLSQLLPKMDINGDQNVDRMELKKWIMNSFHVKEAEEYDKLSPEEAKQRLSQLLPKMDINGDQNVDRMELKKWIMNSFQHLSREEADERMSEADNNGDHQISWKEYLHDSFGVEDERDIGPDDTGDSGMHLQDEKAMWETADTNKDGLLDSTEFEVFINPEEHEVMHQYLINQTLREKDTNQDGRIDFNEFIGDRGTQQDKAWLIAEKDKFDNELDLNRDGILDAAEIHAWVIPDNEEIAEEEVDHLFASADDDHDDKLSFAEIINHHDVFVGSEVTDFDVDDNMLGEHFDDEL